MDNIREILKEIVPKNRNDNDLKIVKRKLRIYNLLNNTNYKFVDLGLKIDSQIHSESDTTFIITYHSKLFNIDFDYNSLEEYKKNEFDSINIIKNKIIRNNNLVTKNIKTNESSYLFNKDDKNRFILEIDFKSKLFFLSFNGVEEYFPNYEREEVLFLFRKTFSSFLKYYDYRLIFENGFLYKIYEFDYYNDYNDYEIDHKAKYMLLNSFQRF